MATGSDAAGAGASDHGSTGAAGTDGTAVPDISTGFHRSRTERVLYALAPWFYPLYGRWIAPRERFVARTKRRLAAAHLPVPVEIYLAGSLGTGVLTGVLMGGLFAALALALGLPSVDPGYVPAVLDPLSPAWDLLSGPVVVGLSLPVGVAVGAASALASASVVPRLRIYQRRREINLLLPDAIAFMYALSVGGMDQMGIIEELADSEDTYGEVAVEFQRIHDEMTYFNRDYRSAVERVAEATPSDPASQFLTDLLSIVNSGGDLTAFLETEKDHQLRAVRQSQEARLDVLELFGQAYLSLSTVPMFALIVFVLMSMLGTPRPVMLFSIVYGLLPGLNFLFIVLLSTVKKDEPGNGRIEADGDAPMEGGSGLLDTGIAPDRAAPVFEQVRRQELRHQLSELLALSTFRRRPATTLAVTVPVALGTLGLWYGLGLVAPSPDALAAAPVASLVAAFETDPVGQTTGWVLVPGLIVLAPLALATEWRHRSRATVTETLTTDVRKMANANEAGNSVLESIRIAAEDNPSPLAAELRRVYKKVDYGDNLSRSLIELTNRYERPRLARSIKLIERAQRASDRITGVLRTTAKLSETHDELDAEYDSRMQQQVAILTVTFLVLLGVLLFLRVFFIPTIGDLVASNENATQALTGASMDRATINLLYFHAALLQATMTGLITGYIRRTSLAAGLKYVVAYTTLTTVLWALVT